MYLSLIVVFAFTAGLTILANRFKEVDADMALKVLATVGSLLTIVIGVIQFTSNQAEQRSHATRDEYIRATQLLTEPGLSRPMAGIVALSQLAEHSSERTWLMTDSLSAFIRNAEPRRDGEPLISSNNPKPILSPYQDPPCPSPDAAIPKRQDTSVEDDYTYRDCSDLDLEQQNPATQAAIKAIASRSPKNESAENVPERYKALFDSANKDLYRGREAPRHNVLRIIATNWRGKHQTESGKQRAESNKRLLDEIQYAMFSGFREIVRRPWLNLSHAEMAGVEVDSGFLEGGDLGQSDLSFGSLSGAKLARADLHSSWLVGSNFFAADLRGANLEYADTRGANFGKTNLQEAWMPGASFRRSNFWRADLSRAYLVASDFREVKTMSGARLDDIVAYRADFSRADISGDGNEQVCMRRAFLAEAKLCCSDLRGVDLRDADLEKADLTNAQLSGADLRGANFNGTKIGGADMSRTDLRGVDLSHAAGIPMTIEGAHIDQQTILPPQLPPGNKKGLVPDNSFKFPEWLRVGGADHCTEKRTAEERGKLFPTESPKLSDKLSKCPQEDPPILWPPTKKVVTHDIHVPQSAVLEINSEPTEAEIELDNTLLGRTPLSAPTYSGEHSLKLAKPGYFIWERKLTISPGNSRVLLQLEAIEH
ncbi:MAG TPA: pentapeptide repeat-containing protein [Candidatus Angelobacter sp.]|nr:pentapeptide repeat-containing protein [Candidatus Angelobacter sp.]